jgi:hypothetical protein
MTLRSDIEKLVPSKKMRSKMSCPQMINLQEEMQWLRSKMTLVHLSSMISSRMFQLQSKKRKHKSMNLIKLCIS